MENDRYTRSCGLSSDRSRFGYLRNGSSWLFLHSGHSFIYRLLCFGSLLYFLEVSRLSSPLFPFHRYPIDNRIVLNLSLTRAHTHTHGLEHSQSVLSNPTVYQSSHTQNTTTTPPNSLRIPLRLRLMTRSRPQPHHGTINKVLQPIMREERLRFRYLNFIRASFPDTLVVSAYRVFQ